MSENEPGRVGDGAPGRATGRVADAAERRKVQLAGNSTFTVSLPKEWATAQGLEPGREVALYPHRDGSLVVRIPRAGDDEVPTVPAGDRSVADLRRTVRACYVAGLERFGVVAADGFTSAARRALADAAADLTGLAVVAEADDEVRFRCALSAPKLSVGETVLNLRHVALSAHRDATTALVDGDDGLATGVDGRLDDVDRQVALVRRAVERRVASPRPPAYPAPDRRAALDHAVVADELRGVAAAAGRIAAIARARETPPTPEAASWLTDYGRRSRTVVEDAVEATIDGGSTARAFEALDGREALDAEVDLLDPAPLGADGPTPHRLVLALAAMRRTADHGATIAEQALRRETDDANR